MVLCRYIRTGERTSLITSSRAGRTVWWPSPMRTASGTTCPATTTCPTSARREQVRGRKRKGGKGGGIKRGCRERGGERDWEFERDVEGRKRQWGRMKKSWRGGDIMLPLSFKYFKEYLQVFCHLRPLQSVSLDHRLTLIITAHLQAQSAHL